MTQEVRRWDWWLVTLVAGVVVAGLAGYWLVAP